MRNDSVSFNISVDGDTTGEKFLGAFKAKTRLSHRDQLARDKIRRELLGDQAEGASMRAQNQAEIFSQLAVRIVDAPNWWTASGNGLDLTDDNVVAAVFEGALQIEADALAEIRKKAEAAKAALANEVK